MARTDTSQKRSLNPRLMARSVEFEVALERNEFIRRLRAARHQAGLTQEQAAQKIGVTLKTWNRWESMDGHTPRVGHIEEMARGLGVDVDYLLGDLHAGRERPDKDLAKMLAIIDIKLDALLQAGGIRLTGLPDPPSSILDLLNEGKSATKLRRRRKA